MVIMTTRPKGLRRSTNHHARTSRNDGWRLRMVRNRAWGEASLPDITMAVLYNIYSEHITRFVLEEHHDGITIGGRRKTNLRFADDTTLLCTSKEELLVMLKRVRETSRSQNILLSIHEINIIVVDIGKKGKRTSF